MSWDRLLSPEILIFMIPIVAIIGGCMTACFKLYFRHVERIALIEQGLHPDYLCENSEELAPDPQKQPEKAHHA